MKKLSILLNGLLGLLLVLAFGACVVLAIHDMKAYRRGVVLIPQRP